MSNVLFDIKDFERMGIDVKMLDSTLTDLGMELESVKDGVVEISITPNRPDMLDFIGIMRAIEYMHRKRHPKENHYIASSQVAKTITVSESVSTIRPYISAIVARNVNLSDNILKYLINFTEKICDTYGRKRKKIAIGLHDLNKISGDLAYDATDNGFMVPLNEEAKRSFADIIKSSDMGIKYGDIIKNKEGLIPYLSDEKNVIAIIPILNSNNTKVTSSTKDLFVDITGMSQDAIDAIADILSCSFIDMGAIIEQCKIVYKKSNIIVPSLKMREITIKRFRIDETIGVKFETREAISFIERLGYNGAVYGTSLIAKVPPYRIDVLNDQDVIEDIAIGFGYNKIEPLKILSPKQGLFNDMTLYTNKVAMLMVGLGFMECSNNYLTSENVNFDMVNITKIERSSVVSIEYSKSPSINMLRTHILPNLLQNLSISAHEAMPQRMFEIGSVFMAQRRNFKESLHLSFVVEHSKSNFSEIKSNVLAILNMLNIKYELKMLLDPTFIEGRCAAIYSGNKMIGKFGELHPSVLLNFSLEEPAASAEICLVDDVKYDSRHLKA